MPPILSTSHCEFYGTHSYTHAQKTIPLVLIHPFTKQIIPSLYQESSTNISWRSISPVPLVRLINHFQTFLRASFFLLLSSFSSHTFSWACGSLREPRKYFFKYSFYAFTLSSNNSLISYGFQPNLYQGFSHVCSTYHTIFSLK